MPLSKAGLARQDDIIKQFRPLKQITINEAIRLLDELNRDELYQIEQDSKGTENGNPR